jgi:hypothetical protein
MVSCQEFIICRKFLNNCLSSYPNEEKDDKEERLKTYVEQIFGDNGLSDECKTEICQKYLGFSKTELENKVQSLADIQTGSMLAPCRFPYVFSLSDHEQDIYFGIIDSYCQHTKKCDCRLVMPHRHGEEEWEEIYGNLQELFDETTELLFLKMDKLEENLSLRQGLISKSIIRGAKIQWKTFFYQKIRVNKFAFRAFVTKDKKICYFSK